MKKALKSTQMKRDLIKSNGELRNI